jgi:hypothetical membrane protein
MAQTWHESSARTTVGRSASRDGQLAGVALFLVGGAFLIGTMLAASIAPGYDMHAGAISDLGVIASTSALFNALLIAVGTSNAVGGWLYWREHRRTGALAFYVLAGVGAIGAGLMPLDTGAPHSLFALAGFVFFNLEAIATAFLIRGPIRWLSFAAGSIGIVFVAVMVIGDSGRPEVFGAIGHGGTERLIVYPVMLWLLALGGWLMHRPLEGASGSESA